MTTKGLYRTYEFHPLALWQQWHARVDSLRLPSPTVLRKAPSVNEMTV